MRKKNLDLIEQNRRKWLIQRGKIAAKKYQISDEQLAKLYEYFLSLDLDASGSISADELQLPLLGLGLVSSVEEVEDLINQVDKDGSGEIEFEEFISILIV